MTTFEDGPAEGKTLMLQRTPVLLRVVVSPDGAVDALDQPDDIWNPGEQITVYILASRVGSMFVDGVRDGKRFGHRTSSGRYRVYSRQPPQERARQTDDWVEWCQDNQDHALAEHARLVPIS